MFKLGTLFFIIIGMVVTTSFTHGRLEPSIKSCRVFLQNVALNFTTSPFQRINQSPRASGVTVRISGQYYGVAGGTLYRLIRNPGESWFTREHLENGELVQGDPRALALLIGWERASSFSFFRLNDDVVFVPNAEELNSQIKKYNDQLPEGSSASILIKFYTPAQSEVPLDEFVKKFAFDGVFPLASSGPEFFHDRSSHLALILIPNLVLRMVQARQIYVLRFIEFVESKLPLPEMSPELFKLKFRNEFISQMAQEIERGSYFPMFLFEEQIDHRNSLHVQSHFWNGFNIDLSPQDYLNSKIDLALVHYLHHTSYDVQHPIAILFRRLVTEYENTDSARAFLKIPQFKVDKESMIEGVRIKFNHIKQALGK